MSWVDQCKASFKFYFDAAIHTLPISKGAYPGRRSIMKLLKQFSEESQIPQNVLARWHYEKEQEELTGESFTIPLCKECKKNPIAISKFSGKPVQTGPTVGLCFTCRTRMRKRRV
jgi:hypothetical protein